MPIISLQGGMAVGKTTLAHRLKDRLNKAEVAFEYPKKRPDGLDMFKEKDYYKIQRYFINLEIERYKALPPGNAIIDLGPEEIEFYTLFFPKSIGQNWDVEKELKEELTVLRDCKVDGILYLDGSPEILFSRKLGDSERKRGSFENYIKYLHPFKKPWFEKNKCATILNIDNMNPEITLEWTLNWLKQVWNIE